MPLFRNAATVFTTSVVAIPIAFIARLVLTRYLSVADRGEYGLAIAFASLAFVVVQLGLPAVVIYEHRRGACPPPRMMSTHLAANVLTSLLGVFLCLALPQAWRGQLFPGVGPGAYLLAAWIVPGLVLGEFLRAVARSLDRFDLHNVFTVLQPIGLGLAWLVSLVFWGGALLAALWSFALVQYGLVAWLAVKLVGIAGVEPRLEPRAITSTLGYGLSTWVQNVLIFLQERLELFLLAFLVADAHPVGLYSVAVSTATPFRLVPNALSVAVFPELAQQGPERAAHTAALLTRHSVGLTALICALAMPLVPWVVPLFYGTAYAASVPALLWLLPGICVLSAGRLLARWFQAVGRQRVLVIARGIAVLVNGAGCLLWVPGSGIVGAAQASLAANAAEALLIGIAFCAHTKMTAREAFAPRRGDLELYRVRVTALVARLRSRAPMR